LKNKGLNGADWAGWWPDVAELSSKYGGTVYGGIQRKGDLLLIPTTYFHMGFTLV